MKDEINQHKQYIEHLERKIKIVLDENKVTQAGEKKFNCNI
jgi:hypothetical protein